MYVLVNELGIFLKIAQFKVYGIGRKKKLQQIIAKIVICQKKSNCVMYRVRNWNVKCHVKPNYSLISDLIVNKIQVDILPTLLDNIIQEIFGPASIWPQQRL